MDRRRTLMIGGAVLAGAVAVGALAGSVGIFGLSDDPPRVGKLSPIDATRSTTGTAPASDSETPFGSTPGSAPAPTTTPAAVGSPPPTTITAPSADDHGGDDPDNRGSGSSHSGGEDDSGSGRDHFDDD